MSIEGGALVSGFGRCDTICHSVNRVVFRALIRVESYDGVNAAGAKQES